MIRMFLKMLHLATSSLMLKISAFTIVYNVVFTSAYSLDLNNYFNFAFNTYINCF